MSRAEVPRFTVEALARFLVAPDAGERLSPVGHAAARSPSDRPGPGALVLDLAASDDEEALRWAAVIAEQLPILPCVTIAVTGPRPEDGTAGLGELCDVVVGTDDEADAVLAGFADTPIAGLAFAQLLRGAPSSSIHAGLVAESFVYSTLQSGAEFGRWLEGRRARRGRRGRRAEEDGPPCRVERDRGRLEIRLARPMRHNAFSRAMRDALVEALQLVLADPSIEAVVLSGEGPSFCSGGDLDEFGSFPDPAEAHAVRTTRSPALLLARLAERVRTEVHGACIGAGAELPAFTGRVVASEDAFFQLPEVALGLVPGAGGTTSLPRRIGRQRTAWLGLSGARIDARTALAWGLVDEVRLEQHRAPAAAEGAGRRGEARGDRGD